MICVGAAGAIGSLLAGFLVKIIGRWPVIISAALTNLVLIFIILYIWIPNPDHVEIFYILAAVSGLADSALLTQTTCKYV